MSELACEGVNYNDVLHDVSVAVRPGRVTALLGASGAGKSTLLWVLAGVWKPSAGKVTHDGGKIGMVFQQPGLWDHMSVEQHLKAVGAKPEVAEKTIAQMRLNELRRRKPGSMSGGERQRLSIARALAIEPAWLLLDEPMAHLDGPTRGELFELLRAALRDTRAGVLLATHHAEEALRLADDVVVVSAGRVVQQGAAADVYRQPTDLAVAQVTGPAAQFHGRIVRPELLTFEPDAAGDAVVERCEFLGRGYLLMVTAGDGPVAVFSEGPHNVGARGEVRRVMADES